MAESGGVGETDQVEMSGTYQHFKGQYYEVIGIAFHTETLQELVAYRKVGGIGQMWVRPRSMFYDTVTNEAGREVPRFRKL